MARAKRLNTALLNAARTARAEFFALMLSEKAHKVHGRYTDAWERLDKAIRAAEDALKKEKED
jgi:hypothetical protein